MEKQINYTFGEIILLIVSVLIGTLAFLAFAIISKKRKVTVLFAVLVLFINLFVTHVITELIKLKNWIEYKSIIQPIVAFMGLYILEWFDSRYLKIFDSISRKAGLELDKKEENEPEKPEENGG